MSHRTHCYQGQYPDTCKYGESDCPEKPYEPPKVAQYWVEVDPATKNPTGRVCWAYYPGDEPADGTWIKVREVKE